MKFSLKQLMLFVVLTCLLTVITDNLIEAVTIFRSSHIPAINKTAYRIGIQGAMLVHVIAALIWGTYIIRRRAT